MKTVNKPMFMKNRWIVGSKPREVWAFSPDGTLVLFVDAPHEVCRTSDYVAVQ